MSGATHTGYSAPAPHAPKAIPKPVVLPKTFGEHAALFVRGRHPRVPIEIYPILGICMFSLSFMTWTGLHTAVTASDVAWLPSKDTRPWDKMSAVPEVPVKSVIATGDGITERRFHYPKADSFFTKKFVPH